MTHDPTRACLTFNCEGVPFFGETESVGYCDDCHAERAAPLKEVCEDCETEPATVRRILSASFDRADIGHPYDVCDSCDPGPGCRPIVWRGRYSNGTPEYTAVCPQCGWRQVGSSSSEGTASREAARHRHESTVTA